MGWLEVPVEKDEIRYETLLKLFFAGDSGPKTAIRHIENFESKIRGGLPILRGAIENLESVLGEDDSHLYYYDHSFLRKAQNANETYVLRSSNLLYHVSEEAGTLQSTWR